MDAPIASRPLTCWSTGRKPIAHPPGSDTRASPQRASSGPSARIDARIVFTSSYGASGQSMCAASSATVPGCEVSSLTPICDSSDCMVRTSLRRGTLLSVTGSGDSSAAHSNGNAAFLAPDARISPCNGPLPAILSLSTVALLPLLRCERLHGQRVNLLAHAIAERRIHELMLLDARQARERGRDDDSLEVMAVTAYFDVLAGQPRLERGADRFRCYRHWF